MRGLGILFRSPLGKRIYIFFFENKRTKDVYERRRETKKWRRLWPEEETETKIFSESVIESDRKNK